MGIPHGLGPEEQFQPKSYQLIIKLNEEGTGERFTLRSEFAGKDVWLISCQDLNRFRFYLAILEDGNPTAIYAAHEVREGDGKPLPPVITKGHLL